MDPHRLLKMHSVCQEAERFRPGEHGGLGIAWDKGREYPSLGLEDRMEAAGELQQGGSQFLYLRAGRGGRSKSPACPMVNVLKKEDLRVHHSGTAEWAQGKELDASSSL